MISQVFEVYEVGTDGSSVGKHIDYVSSEKAAKDQCVEWYHKYRRIHVVKGADHRFYRLASVEPIQVNQSLADKERDKALAKLTPKDRKALGIK